MGYSYGWNERGNRALACDGCGTCESTAGVRKRTCPHKVLSDSLGSSDGKRHSLPWCPAPALCAGCMRAHGGTFGVHKRCKESAAQAQAEADAKQAKLDAGGYHVTAAYGAWHETVPDGMAGVIFQNLAGSRAWMLVPEADYNPGKRPWLADYPQAQAWSDHAA